MSDAVDRRIVEAIDAALGLGRDATVAAASGLFGEGAEAPARAAADAGAAIVRRYLLTFFEGSGRVDVAGDVPVVVTIRD